MKLWQWDLHRDDSSYPTGRQRKEGPYIASSDGKALIVEAFS